MYRYNFCWLADRPLKKRSLDLIYNIDPKKVRKNVGNIEVPTDIPTEFQFGDIAADMQRRRGSGNIRREGRQRNN